jgi:hypothetical protein
MVAAIDSLIHRPMLYRLSYAHHRLIADSLTLFFYTASVCTVAIEGSFAIWAKHPTHTS